MTTNDSRPRRMIPWPARVSFPLGKTRKQRQVQHRQQINALFFVIMAAVLFGLVVVWINYQNAGSSKEVNCESYPQYCVPFAGGSTLETFVANESESSRALDAASEGADGVVRGIVDDTMPFIGNPSAPVEFAVIAAFSCSHCQNYHSGDLERILNDFALTGKAAFRSLLIARYQDDLTATQAALCAGEQGAYWEMTDELFRIASSSSLSSAFAVPRLKETAEDMGLDGEALATCITSGRYLSAVEANQLFVTDNGVTSTPTVLVRVAGSDDWNVVGRGYDSIKTLIDSASQP